MTKKITLFMLAIVLSVISCSKDDNPETAPIDTNGGEIFTSQVVTVNIPGVSLSQNEYQGTLGGVPVTLIKSGDSSLVFSVPTGQTGTGDLIIPALNVTIHYTTTQTILEGTPDEVMADFTANLSTFAALLDSSPEASAVQNTINSFNTYYNNADEATKRGIAETYQANKTVFDQILLSDNAGRIIVAGTEIYISKHVTAVALIGVGVAALVSPALGAVVIGVAAYKAYKANADAVEHVYSTIGATIDGWFNRNVNFDGIVLQNDEMEQVSFSLRERAITAADQAKTDPLAVQYFNSVELYNYYAAEGNEVIENVNDDEGTNFSTIPSQQIPASASTFETEVNQEIFSNMQFSINNPGLLLVHASVATEGTLNLRVKILGTPSSLPVESTLNYTYSDGFSSFTGSVPISIEYNPFVGTWVLESFENGTPLGEYVQNGWAQGCPSIITNSYTILNRTLVFTENTYSGSGTQIYVDHNLSWNSSCQITANDPDTSETTNDSDSGTYTFNASTLIVTESEDGETIEVPYTFITPTRLSIEGEIYNKQ